MGVVMHTYHLILNEQEIDIEAENISLAKRQAVRMGLKQCCDVSIQDVKGHLWVKHIVQTAVGPDYSQWERVDTALSLDTY